MTQEKLLPVRELCLQSETIASDYRFFHLFLQNRTLKSNLLYLNFHPAFLSKTFGQALDRLVNVS